jgi:hypothetical protein
VRVKITKQKFMLKKPTVRVLPLQAYCLVFGDFEVHLIIVKN